MSRLGEKIPKIKKLYWRLIFFFSTARFSNAAHIFNPTPQSALKPRVWKDIFLYLPVWLKACFTVSTMYIKVWTEWPQFGRCFFSQPLNVDLMVLSFFYYYYFAHWEPRVLIGPVAVCTLLPPLAEFSVLPESVAGHSVYFDLLTNLFTCQSFIFFSSVLFNKHSSNQLNSSSTNQYWSQPCGTQVI